jgi:hypothetical protein
VDQGGKKLNGVVFICIIYRFRIQHSKFIVKNQKQIGK